MMGWNLRKSSVRWSFERTRMAKNSIYTKWLTSGVVRHFHHRCLTGAGTAAGSLDVVFQILRSVPVFGGAHFGQYPLLAVLQDPFEKVFAFHFRKATVGQNDQPQKQGSESLVELDGIFSVFHVGE